MWPVTQAMVDLLGGGDPFSELLLNLLARRGVFTSEECASANSLVQRLQVSGAMAVVERLGGEHPCQILGRDIHRIVLEHLASQDLPLPAYDYAADFSPEAVEALDGVQEPAWARMVQPFMGLLEVKDRQAVFRACLTNLQVVAEHCHSSQEMVFPAFLTMLFAPNTLRDFLDLEGNRGILEQQGSDEKVEHLCALLSKHSLTPRQVVEGLVESFPYLQKVFPKQESESAVDVTVYDLLSGTVPFDLTRLFTFQEHNRYVSLSLYA